MTHFSISRTTKRDSQSILHRIRLAHLLLVCVHVHRLSYIRCCLYITHANACYTDRSRDCVCVWVDVPITKSECSVHVVNTVERNQFLVDSCHAWKVNCHTYSTFFFIIFWKYLFLWFFPSLFFRSIFDRCELRQKKVQKTNKINKQTKNWKNEASGETDCIVFTRVWSENWWIFSERTENRLHLLFCIRYGLNLMCGRKFVS